METMRNKFWVVYCLVTFFLVIVGILTANWGMAQTGVLLIISFDIAEILRCKGNKH